MVGGQKAMSELTVNGYSEALAPTARYVWGEVIRGHEVGPYRILEIHPHAFINGQARGIDREATAFHLFVMDDAGVTVDACNSFQSLDAALAGGIAYRAEGCNHRADRYFIEALESIQRRSKEGRL
jgi:hypothetical protein